MSNGNNSKVKFIISKNKKDRFHSYTIYKYTTKYTNNLLQYCLSYSVIRNDAIQ